MKKRIANKILSKSNQYNHYKKQNKNLKKQNKNLKKQNKQITKKFDFVDFEAFLAHSYVSPVINTPFSNEDKRVFAFMDHLSKHLIKNVRKIENKPLVSVIMPVYNRKDIIKMAIDSVLNQSFTDFEMILADDGSPDNSPKICDEYAKKDNRIVVIHKENGGAPSARNVAIDKANGKYLYFMDGDDWCEKTMLSDLYGLADKYNLDLVVTGFYIDTYYDEDKYYREQRNAQTHIYTSQTEFRCSAHKLFDAQLLYAPWNKLYRREYLNQYGILFPTTFWDDLPFNLDVVRYVERVGTLNGHYYHFLRARAESENTKYRADMYQKREEEHQWMQDLFQFWSEETPAMAGIKADIDRFLSCRYAERLVGCVENVTNKNCTLTNDEKITEIKRMIGTPQARFALKNAKPASSMMKIVLAPYRMNNAFLTKAESEVISWVKQNNTNLFARLKAKQVAR